MLSNAKNKSQKVSLKKLIPNIALILSFVLFICFLAKENKTFTSAAKNEKRHLEEEKKAKIIPYNTPHKVNTVLDHLFYPYHSHIIRNMDDYEFLRDSLGKVNLRLLFNSNIHGDYAQDVHTKTNYHHLVVLIETEKGNRFGGYTSDNFNPESLGLTSTSIDITKPDNCAFLFNLDKKTIYDIKQDKKNYALECDDFFTLNFGVSDLIIQDNFLLEGGSSAFPDYYGENAGQYELTNGEKFFKVKNFEIFQALFYSEFGDEKNKMGKYINYIK